jgi:hypothetical protein
MLDVNEDFSVFDHGNGTRIWNTAPDQFKMGETYAKPDGGSVTVKPATMQEIEENTAGSPNPVTDGVLGDAIGRKSADVRNTEMVKELIARFNGGDRLKNYNAIANEYREAFLSELAGLGAPPAATIEITNKVTPFRLLLAGIGFVVSAICVLLWWAQSHCYPSELYYPPAYWGGSRFLSTAYCVTPGGAGRIMEREPGEVYILAIIPFLVAGMILVVISYVVPRC